MTIVSDHYFPEHCVWDFLSHVFFCLPDDASLNERTTNKIVEVSGLRVLRLEVSGWISKTIGKGVRFPMRFSSFLLYRNCKKLREFEEIEGRGDCE